MIALRTLASEVGLPLLLLVFAFVFGFAVGSGVAERKAMKVWIIETNGIQCTESDGVLTNCHWLPVGSGPR